MATPVADSYSTSSGGVIAAGRHVTPEWYRSSAIGEWSSLPNSTLSSSGVGWSGTNPGGSGGYQAIVGAWGGGCLNTVGIYHGGVFIPGIFLIIFGGGHGDYAGNALYAYGPLESDAPVWRRLNDPTIPAAVNVARSNGYPVSRHSYDALVYLPTVNKMLCIGAAGMYSNGFASNSADLFDFSVNPLTENPWTTADTGFPAFNGGGIGPINMLSSYDSETGKAWGIGQGNAQKIGSYTVSDGSWQSWNIDNPDGTSNGKAGLYPDKSLLVFFSGSGGVRAVDLRSAPSLYSPSVTGSPPSIGRALDWDSKTGSFVSWSQNSNEVHFLSPGANPYNGGDAWAWSSVSPTSGATPTAPSASGHLFGRFRVVNKGGMTGYLVMSLATSAIYFYRT